MNKLIKFLTVLLLTFSTAIGQVNIYNATVSAEETEEETQSEIGESQQEHSSDEITIQFDGQGAEGSLPSIKLAKGKLYHLPKNVYFKDGFQFVGWSTNENGQVEYQDEDEIIIEDDASFLVLYAVWEQLAIDPVTQSEPSDDELENIDISPLALGLIPNYLYKHMLFGTVKRDFLSAIDVKIDANGRYAGYVAVGASDGSFSGATNNGKRDGWIVESDALGNVTYRLLGTPENDRFTGVAVKYDASGNYAGYVAVGVSEGQPVGTTKIGGQDGWIVEVDVNGGIKHTLVGTTALDTLSAVRVKYDSSRNYQGYLVVGYTEGRINGGPKPGGQDGWIVESDANGTITQKLIGTINADILSGLEIKYDQSGNYNGFVAVGWSYVSQQRNYDGWMLEMDATGNPVNRYTGSSASDYLVDVDIKYDASGAYLGYIASGYSYGSPPGTVNSGNFDGWIVEVSPTGSISNKLFGTGTSDYLPSVSIKYDASGNYDGYVAVGYTAGSLPNTVNSGDLDGWILETDGSGNVKHVLPKYPKSRIKA